MSAVWTRVFADQEKGLSHRLPVPLSQMREERVCRRIQSSMAPISRFRRYSYSCTLWSTKTSTLQATYHTSVSNTTTIQWYLYFRDICPWKLLRESLVLGGVDRCVQIHESVMVKAKYHHGRQLCERQRWVFGICDPQLKEGYIELVDERDAATLLPIIQKIVSPGTTIWSDEWVAYAQLSTLGFIHQMVNH